MDEIKLITQILNNRDLRLVEENESQKDLAKEIHLRLEMYKIKKSLTKSGY